MFKLLLTATITLLVTLATLTACSDPTPAPETLAPTSAPSPTAAPTPTELPVPTESQAERPAAAPTATPANTPAPEPTPTTNGRIAPLQMQDSGAFRSALSEAELACIGENPERQTRFVGCLEDETLARVFLAGFVPGPGPLSQNTSDCVRAAFEVIDPRAVMTAGIEGDPGRAMAGSMAALSVTVACLTDQEWGATAPMLGMSPDERAGMQCLMEALGGPGQMAAAMTAAQEGEFAELASAGAECGLEMGPPPGQPPGTPPPAPTATPEAATPAPTTTTPGFTPTRVPTTATPTPAPTPANIPSTSTLVITVAAIPAELPEYDRSDWRHWIDEDGDCQDARQEVLIEESLEPVTFESDRECRVATGQWWAPHLGHHLGNPGHLDVDHHVPLKNAHLSGGWSWDAAKKEQYANYLGEENHLVAISSRHNRSKGARGPEEWSPPDNALWCDYATDWTEIKERWGLRMTPVESEIVMDMLGTCENPPKVDVRTTLGKATGEHKPTAEPEETVYGSCEAAEDAGETLVQGSQGGGRGFPAKMVPSARDGDGDGVVCER